MSEQLSLEGLTGASPDQKPSKLRPKAEGSKTKSELAIEARISALVEERKRMDSVLPPPPAQQIPTPEIQAQPIQAQQDVVQTAIVEIEETTVVVEPEPEVLTVTALNKAIKGMLEKSFAFLWVKGEISNFKIPSSGHMYFTLKDSGAQVRAIMFRGFAQQLKFKPEDGMEVLVRCRVTVYEPRGDYQLFCEVMEPVGFGALQVAFEKLKAKLQSEGLFDQARKKTIPVFPTRIGIVTSPTGAAIRDMLNVLGRRFGGGLDITIFPAAVQGDKAPGELVKAINLAHEMGPQRFDVLIVGRGGGSLEDLWAFNIEEVARAVARCCIPTISAVGHEVDFTICDFVADLRAPTPSAAAELVVKNKADLLDRISLLQRQFVQQMRKRLQLARAQTDGASKRLVDPKRKLQDLMLRTDEWFERLIQTMNRYLGDSSMEVRLLHERLGTPEKRLALAYQDISSQQERLRLLVEKILDSRRNRFAGLANLLNGLSPLGVLDRGYSIVKKAETIIKDASQVQTGDEVKIVLHKGELRSRIL